MVPLLSAYPGARGYGHFLPLGGKSYLAVEYQSEANKYIYLWTAASDTDGNLYFPGMYSENVSPTTNAAAIAYSKVPERTYSKVLLETGNALYTSILFYAGDVDSSGNLYAVGYVNINGAVKAVVAKYNSSGVLQWQKRLGSSDASYFFGAKVAPNGKIYLSGYISDVGYNKVAVIQIDDAGAIQWQKYYWADQNGSDSSIAPAIDVDSDSNVYVGHYSYYFPGGSLIARNIVTKFNSSGTEQWSKQINPNGTSMKGLSVSSSNIVHVLYTSGGAPGYAYLARLDTSGALTGNQRKIYGDNLEIWMGCDDEDGDIYLAGYNDFNSNPSVTDFKSVIIKYNSSSTIQWQRSLSWISSTYSEYSRISSKAKDVFTVTAYHGNPDYGNRNASLIATLPKDGSKTGAYTVGTSPSFEYTYESSSLSESDATEEITVSSFSNVYSSASFSFVTLEGTDDTGFTSSVVKVI